MIGGVCSNTSVMMTVDDFQGCVTIAYRFTRSSYWCLAPGVKRVNWADKRQMPTNDRLLACLGEFYCKSCSIHV